MSIFHERPLEGVIPATLLAFNIDYEIDESESRRHLRDVAATDGLSAITVNGHASEVHACTFDEQKRILDFCQDELNGALPLINGIYADGSRQAADLARMAETGGSEGPSPMVPSALRLRRASASCETSSLQMWTTRCPLVHRDPQTGQSQSNGAAPLPTRTRWHHQTARHQHQRD